MTLAEPSEVLSLVEYSENDDLNISDVIQEPEGGDQDLPNGAGAPLRDDSAAFTESRQRPTGLKDVEEKLLGRGGGVLGDVGQRLVDLP